MVRRHQADVRQISVALGVVHAVTDDEEVGNGEADIIRVDFLNAAGGLVKQRGNAQGFGVLLHEELAQIGEREAGVEDVFDDQDILAFDGLVVILDELDGAGGALSLAIAGGGDKVERRVDLHGSSEIRQKRRSAFEYADHNELFAIEVLRNLGAHFGDAVGNLLAGKEDLKSLRSDGCHAHSIARIGRDVCANRGVNGERGSGTDRVYTYIDMLPYLHIWHFNVPTFGLMLWLAAVAGAFVMDRGFKRAGISTDKGGADAVGMVAIAVVAGIVGAKLWHVADTPTEFRELGWRVLWDSAGFAWFGGLIFGISALVFQGWRARIGGLRTLDLAAPAAAIGYGIGRIGCFLSGDGCYGLPTNLPWGMSFPNGIEPTPPFVRVQPTPLYELAAGLLIGWWLWKRGGRAHGNGAIVGEYLVLSGTARFLVEFVRRNPKVLWELSNAQLASAGSVLAGILLVWWASTRRETAPAKAGIVAEKTA